MNADDIRRIVIEALSDANKITPEEIQLINFIDPIAKEEILLRKSVKAVVIV